MEERGRGAGRDQLHQLAAKRWNQFAAPLSASSAVKKSVKKRSSRPTTSSSCPGPLPLRVFSCAVAMLIAKFCRPNPHPATAPHIYP